MGLILRFGPHPTPLHVADNGLSAFVDVDVFDRYLLLAFATMAVEGFEQRRIGARLRCLNSSGSSFCESKAFRERPRNSYRERSSSSQMLLVEASRARF